MKQSPGLYSTRTVSNTIPVLKLFFFLKITLQTNNSLIYNANKYSSGCRSNPEFPGGECVTWAESGQCTSNPGFMRDYCTGECCPESPTPTPTPGRKQPTTYTAVLILQNLYSRLTGVNSNTNINPAPL